MSLFPLILQQKWKLLLSQLNDDTKQHLLCQSWGLESFTIRIGFFPRNGGKLPPLHIPEHPTKRSRVCSLMRTHFCHTFNFSSVVRFSLTLPSPKVNWLANLVWHVPPPPLHQVTGCAINRQTHNHSHPICMSYLLSEAAGTSLHPPLPASAAGPCLPLCQTLSSESDGSGSWPIRKPVLRNNWSDKRILPRSAATKLIHRMTPKRVCPLQPQLPS